MAQKPRTRHAATQRERNPGCWSRQSTVWFARRPAPARSMPCGRRSLPRCWTRLPEPQRRFLRDLGFKAKPSELHSLPGPDGIAAAVLGLGDDRSPYAFGGLAFRLPEDSTWRLATRRLRLGHRDAGFRPRRLPLHRTEGGGARAGSTGRAGRSHQRTVAGRRHLDGARPDQHARQSARPGRTGGGRRRPGPPPRRGRGRERRRRAGCGLSHRRRGRPRLVASAACCHAALARQQRACGCTAGIIVRQGRLFRHRRLRPEAVQRHAAHEEGHGRRRLRAGLGPHDHGSGSAASPGGPRRLRGEFRFRHGDAAARCRSHA